MGVLFIDGFDHYATGEIDRKWGDSNSNVTIDSTSPRRAGSQHLKFTASTLVPAITHYTAAVENTIVCGFAFKTNSVATLHRGFVLYRSGTAQSSVVIESDGSISVKRGDYNGTILEQSAAGVISINTWYYLEFKIYVHDSAGTYEVRINEVDVVSGSGVDTQASATSGVDAVTIKGEYSGGQFQYVDDLYIADDDFIGDCRVDSLWPDGAGNYSQWTPDPSGSDNYENVDDSTDQDDDTTHNITGSLNEIDTYTFDDLAAISGSSIHAIAVNIGIRKDDAGQRKVTPLIRMSSTDYTGTEVAAYDNYKTPQEIWANPPDAPSVAWDDSDVNGAEFGVKLTT